MRNKSEVFRQALALPGDLDREELVALYDLAMPYTIGVDLDATPRTTFVLANVLYHTITVNETPDPILASLRQQLPISSLNLASVGAERVIGRVDLILARSELELASWRDHLRPGGAIRYRTLEGWQTWENSSIREPCFLFHVCNDEPLAIRLIREIRSLYPSNPILAIADGHTNDQPFRDEVASQRVELVEGEWLKAPETGGAWVERMLREFLTRSEAEVLIKLDPDSRLHRRFKSMPRGDWFGSINHSYFRPLVRGGCLGLSRRACELILASEILSDPIYQGLTFRYLSEGIWLAFTDGIIADACFKLGLTPSAWEEVLISNREEDLRGSSWAVTHPHKQVTT